MSEPGTVLARGRRALCSIVWYDVFDCIVVVYDLCGQYDLVHVLDIQHRFEQL